MPFSDRLTHAADIARRAHNTQTRKGSDVPYLSHLFAVAALVMESGGSEDQVCAALLHDVLEDAGVSWSDEIRAELGEHVLALVTACTDGLPDAEGHKESWRTRKHRYIEHCSQDTPLEREALVICAADKLHNLRSLLIDLREHGPYTFLKFVKDEPTLRGKGEATLWYYETLLAIFERRGIPTARLLRPAVAALREIVRDLP